MNLKKRLTITYVILLSIPVFIAIVGFVLVLVSGSDFVPRPLFMEVFIALIAALLIMALILTTWTNKGVFAHIRKLNEAMDCITKGNFDYVLPTDECSGEIGELFKSYEDMRLRLKESSEDTLHNEQKNRELISNITHDLKTPITAIKGYVEGIMDGVADTDEKKEKYVKTIYNKAIEMDRLINE
ncbi:MAG: two-component sensor histidine kinase, partial [Lachnospiraceae bacterium]|nr:two-component sensor histidine kinase [Lachnospiraceae bacterium]